MKQVPWVIGQPDVITGILVREGRRGRVRKDLTMQAEVRAMCPGVKKREHSPTAERGKERIIP